MTLQAFGISVAVVRLDLERVIQLAHNSLQKRQRRFLLQVFELGNKIKLVFEHPRDAPIRKDKNIFQVWGSAWH